MGLRLLDSCLTSSEILPGSFDCGGIGLQTGYRFIAGLRAGYSLLRESYCACGVRPLLVQVRLSLCESGLRGAHLSFGGGCGADHFALVLALRFNGLVELVLIAGNGRLSGLRCRGEIVALNDGDRIAFFHSLAFLDAERLDAAGNFSTDENFIGVDGADELEVTGSACGDEIPDEGSQGKNAKNQENPITRVHLSSDTGANQD